MDWDCYWNKAAVARPGVYGRLAEFYRRQIISRAAARLLHRQFPDAPGRRYLHAGCGSGGSDQRLHLRQACIDALDFSMPGLRLNRSRELACRQQYVCGDLFRLPYQDRTMDGIFNFGVMEHFEAPDLDRILQEFRRVLKPGGRVVLFWPPDFGLSVIALTSFLRIVNAFRKTPMTLYPDEISRIPSRRWVRALMARHGFRTLDAVFGWRDAFTYVVVIAMPAPSVVEPARAEHPASPLHASA